VYGASKLAGEQAVSALVSRHYIVRSAWLFGAGGRNFVQAILEAVETQEEIRVVEDQFGSPTYTKDLARAIGELIVTGRVGPGIYHLVNAGVCSWAELAGEALRITGRRVRVKGLSSEEWPSPTRRPAYSALRSRWLELQGLPPLREWREALKSYLEEAS
jgi:dTDP-4-dehydrorhamnose reductase